jgi:hypothetical protein
MGRGLFLQSGNVQLATNGSTPVATTGAFATLANNTWMNVVISYDGSGTTTLYYDGSFGATVSFTFSAITSGNLKIGKAQYWSYFNGKIDQIRIFNRAITSQEVTTLYNEVQCIPTIVPSENFNTVLYTGNGGTKSVTGVGFQPDWVWIKQRSSPIREHILCDSVRGVNKELSSDNTYFEESRGVNSFDTNGFTLDGLSANYNSNNGSYVAWNWKAGGAPTTTNSAGAGNVPTAGSVKIDGADSTTALAGTIAATSISANTEAGFSIVKYTGTGGTQTVAHGLSNQPKFMFVKNINRAHHGFGYHTDINSTGYIFSDSASSTAAFNSGRNEWANGNQQPTENVFGVKSYVGNNSTLYSSNYLGDNYIAYCFASIPGFSDIGCYVGTGASGNSIVTGFEPAYVMFKRTSSNASGGNWIIKDNKRDTTNPNDANLYANLSAAEEIDYSVNFLSNGFEILETNVDINGNGASYIFMAFAADPAPEPTLEDSFNTVVYTGNGGTQSVTGVGFQPDLVWTKGRTVAYDHGIQDSVRGINSLLYTSLNQQETITSIATQSFDSDGFTYGSNNKGNANDSTYVAWNWKGAEIPAINSNGSITSIVSANPAAGFSIVSYTANGVDNSTIGHGLGVEPKFIITKRRDSSASGGNWYCYHFSLGTSFTLVLNGTNAQIPTSNSYKSIGSSTYTIGTNGDMNTNNGTFIAYCFAEVAGFSKFGSYTGNAPLGGTGSPIPINCGFEPAFVMIKYASGSYGSGSWGIWDNKRDTTNPNTKFLIPNSSIQEIDNAIYNIDFDPTGFTVGATANDVTNLSGNTYIYMAFANQF